MIVLYAAGDTYLHKLNARLKLLLLAIMGTVLFPIQDLYIHGGFLVSVMVLYFIFLKHQAIGYLLMIKPLWVLYGILMIYHYVIGDLYGGLVIVMRLTCLIWLANLMTLTTRLDDMISAIEPLFILLRPLGLSSRKFALMVAMTIRFIPLLLAVWQDLSLSWRARSQKRPGWRLLIPFFVRTLVMSEHLAQSLISRSIDLNDNSSNT